MFPDKYEDFIRVYTVDPLALRQADYIYESSKHRINIFCCDNQEFYISVSRRKINVEHNLLINLSYIPITLSVQMKNRDDAWEYVKNFMDKEKIRNTLL